MKSEKELQPQPTVIYGLNEGMRRVIRMMQPSRTRLPPALKRKTPTNTLAIENALPPFSILATTSRHRVDSDNPVSPRKSQGRCCRLCDTKQASPVKVFE